MNSFDFEKRLEFEENKKNSSNPKYITQNDFIYFKNEILKDLKMSESKLTMKLDLSKKEFETKFINIENKLDSYKSEDNPFSTKYSKDYSEKLNNLFNFKENCQEKLFIHEKKIKEINDYSKESIYSLNKLIHDNITCPGIIGKNAKFSTFQHLVDHILTSLNYLNAFKDKMIALDIQNYKNKLDKLIQSFKVQMDTFVESAKKATTDSIIIFENKGNELYSKFDNKLENEKSEIENKINIINKKIGEEHNLISNNKNELMNVINNHILLANENFTNIDSKYEKTINEIENVGRRNEELNENIKKLSLDLKEKMSEQEHKLIVKMSHLYTVMKDFNNELNKRFKSLIQNGDGVQYNNFNLDKLFENNINIIRNSEPEIPNIELKSSHSVGSLLKKYIDGEIGLNEFLHSTRDKKIKRKTSRISNFLNNLNDSETKNNQFPDSDNNRNINNQDSTNEDFFQNIKHIKLDKSAILKNYPENYNNKLFLNREKLGKIIINKENIMLNKVPRKEIIRTLLMGNPDPFCFYLMKKKLEKSKKMKLNFNSKGVTERLKSPLLSKGKSEINLLSQKRINYNSFHFNKKEKKLFNTGEDAKQTTNDENNDYQEGNKRTLSSLNDRTRNNANSNSSLNFNNTDFDKNISNISRKNKENKENSKNAIQKGLHSPEAKIYEIHFKNSNLENKSNSFVNKKINVGKNVYKLTNNKKDKNAKTDINFFHKNFNTSKIKDK